MSGFAVLTYNIRHRALDDGPNAWANRREAAAETIRALSPAVLALQESTGTQQADVERALPAYEYHGVADDPGSGEHNPIGVGRRFSTVGTDTEWLSETPTERSTGWDAAYPRVLTTVRLEDERGRRLAVYNAHFDHRGPRAREQSARLIRRRIDALPVETEAVVLGDLNCRPGSAPYRVLSGAEAADTGPTSRSLRDARRVADTADGPDTTVTDFEAPDPGRVLDHVFVTPGLAVETHRIDDRTVEGRYPSDHLPVVAGLRFR